MIIYKTTNLINGKIYVGQDSHNNPNYLGSGLLLKKAVKKYGRKNFKKDTLCECETKEELNKKEVYWIMKLNSINLDVGYNIAQGKNSGTYDTMSNNPNIEDIKKRIKETLRKRYLEDSNYRMKLRKSHLGQKSPLKGKTYLEYYGEEKSEEMRQKLSESHKGNKPSLKNLKKRSVSMLGKNKGNKNGMFGKKLFDVLVEKYGYDNAVKINESRKKKLSEAAKKQWENQKKNK